MKSIGHCQVRLAKPYPRDSGMRISGSLVYADYGDAAIVSDRAPPAFGLKGDYKTNEIWFTRVWRCPAASLSQRPRWQRK